MTHLQNEQRQAEWDSHHPGLELGNTPSIKGLAVSIMACTPGILWKVPSTLDKEPSIRSLASIIVTRAPNIMIQAPKMMRKAPWIRKLNIIRQLWRSMYV